MAPVAKKIASDERDSLLCDAFAMKGFRNSHQYDIVIASRIQVDQEISPNFANYIC